jgi:hypothetical protein
MPGAAALVLISGGSSAMTGIFSSITAARLDSEETLAGDWTSGFEVAAVVEVVVVGGAVPLGLMFSLVAGWEAWGAICSGRGAGYRASVSCVCK